MLKRRFFANVIIVLMRMNVFMKVCVRLEEERRAAEELRSRMEKEREELRTKLKDATSEVRSQVTLTESKTSAVVPVTCEEKEICSCDLRSVGWSH